MARRSLLAAGALVALTGAALTGCGTAGATPEVHAGTAHPVRSGALDAADVAGAQTAFGLDLLHEVCAGAGPGNVLVSPTSAAEALSLLYPAAGGPTAQSIGDLLHLPAWSPDLVAALHEHTAALDRLRYDGDPEDDDAPDSLQVSNHLWTATGVQPDQRYLDDLATALTADVRGLDFAGDPGGATDRVNSTVDEDTRGAIAGLFDEPLPPDTVAVLTDALHLRARWADPFSESAPAPFEAPAGVVDVDMMSGAGGDARFSGGWTSVELPYRDGTLAAVAVLPPAGTDPCAVHAGVLADLDAQRPEPVGVRLPRLEIAQTHGLLDQLTALGMPVTGDYPALGGQLTLDAAVQKTYLRVDEDGTEAAAATGLGTAVSAGSAVGGITFDRPFLLLLTDTATRSPLFTAVVRDPAA